MDNILYVVNNGDMPQNLTSFVTFFVSQHMWFYLLTASVLLQCMLWMKPAHVASVHYNSKPGIWSLGIVEVN